MAPTELQSNLKTAASWSGFRRLMQRQQPISRPPPTVDAVVPDGATGMADIQWDAQCPLTGRHLGTYQTQEQAFGAVWNSVSVFGVRDVL